MDTLVGSLDGILVFDVTNKNLDLLLLQFGEVRGFRLCRARGSKDGDAGELGARGEDGVEDEGADLACGAEEEEVGHGFGGQLGDFADVLRRFRNEGESPEIG